MVYMVSQIWHMWLLQTWSIKHIMCGLKKSHAWPFKYIICSRLNTSCVAGQTRHPWLVNTSSMAGQHLIYGWSNTRGQANRSCVIKQTFYTWLDKCHGWSNISNVASQTRRIYRHSLFVQHSPFSRIEGNCSWFIHPVADNRGTDAQVEGTRPQGMCLETCIVQVGCHPINSNAICRSVSQQDTRLLGRLAHVADSIL